MATTPVPRAHATTARQADRLAGDPAYQAFWLLRIGFTVAPIVFGFDKFFHAAWLAGIIVNLLLIPDSYDIALRDFGLLLAALTLARLATAFPSRRA